MPEREPTEEEMQFLRALDRGQEFNAAWFDVGGRAASQMAMGCVLAGWVNRNKLTPAGQALARRCGKANYDIRDEKGNRV